jgi:hypothetical protein
LTGVTAIEASVGAVMVRVADPLTDPELAVIVAVPAAIAVANPELLMLPIDGADDSQTAVAVRSMVLPSL